MISTMPVSPLICPLHVGQGTKDEDLLGDGFDSGGEEVVDRKDALFGDPIIDHEVLEDENWPGAIPATVLPAPKEMSKAEWTRHCVTHLPYHRGCPVCAATRMPNMHHRASHETSRVVPLIVGDYCFVKSLDEKKTLTVLVLKL